MRNLWRVGSLLFVSMAAFSRSDSPASTIPMPENYREWVWPSSGLGMSYEAGGGSDNPMFDNVFASPEAYAGFRKTGTWPNNTQLMLEIRKSGSNASINQHGHFQTELADLASHVKNSKGEWAFYSFSKGSAKGKLIPKQANCYSCHQEHAAVDTTFVQFYPTLIDIAKAKGTFK